MPHGSENILEVKIEYVRIPNGRPDENLLSGIEFAVAPCEIVAITGKNGAGKSTILNCILRLNDGREMIDETRIEFSGSDISKKDAGELTDWRRNKIAFVPQNAFGSFDPLKKISYYFNRINTDMNRTAELFDYFLLGEPRKIMEQYPHQLSGGMAQRIMIILGLLKNPELMILDEPNSAVDLPLSNLISSSLKAFKNENGKSVLFITQDVNFAFNTADRILVLDKSGIHAPKDISSPEQLENFIARKNTDKAQ